MGTNSSQICLSSKIFSLFAVLSWGVLLIAFVKPVSNLENYWSPVGLSSDDTLVLITSNSNFPFLIACSLASGYECFYPCPIVIRLQ
jgi:hypothetical protein